MPIYEYQCGKCGNVMSLIVKGFDDPKGLVCESCGSNRVKRIISQVNFTLPGGEGARKDDGYYRDTRNIGVTAEQMLKKAGVEPSDEFKSKLDNVRSDPGNFLKNYKS